MRILATPRSRWLAAGILATLSFTVIVFASKDIGVSDAQLVSYYETGDFQKIVVSVAVGVGDEIVGSSVTEDATGVRVTVRVRQFTGSRTAGLLFLPAVVRVPSALRDRPVLDSTGRPLPNLGFYRAIPTPSGVP